MVNNVLEFILDSSIRLIDINTLIILFCLMGVVEGLKELGYIDAISHKLVLAANNLRALMTTAVFATYVMSMIVTNDVGLIIMVPFTIQVLKGINRKDKMIKLIVLETVAANLGGMATPIGNPHNLYTYQFYDMNEMKFILTLLPFAITSLALLSIIILLDKSGKDAVEIKAISEKECDITKGKKIVLTVGYIVLFMLCLGIVMDLVPGDVPIINIPFMYVPFVIEIVFIMVGNAQVIKNINYGLLIKFVILYIIVGNLARLPWINNNLGNIVEGNEFFLGIALSQFMSNLPVAMLLTRFSQNGYDVMMGANIGGFGTIIASMASVISLEFYSKLEDSNLKKYYLEFTKYGLIVLIVMVLVKICVNLI